MSPPSPGDKSLGFGGTSPPPPGGRSSPGDNSAGVGRTSLPSLGGKSASVGDKGDSAAALDFTRLAAINLGRHFGRRKALAQVSFECHAGEIVGLLGPNGAGKSTLLSILSTLLAPSTGRVEYGNSTATPSGAALRARLGMLGHDLYLYPELTARENLMFFARLYGLANVARAVDEGLAHAALTTRGDDQVGGFSRGMRQRLALERALLHHPRLLLLDEPFTGLDQASSAALVERLKGLRDEGCLILLATHDLDVAEDVLSRSLFLRNGRLAAEGRGSDLRARYRDVMAQP